MAFTIIAPVHNEERYIYSWLQNCTRLHPSELIIGLDRCTDKTEGRIRKYLSVNRVAFDIIIKRYEKRNEYRMQAAGIRRDLYCMAKHDTILNTSADLLLDPEIRHHLKKIPEYRLISFGYFDYPWNVQSFLRYFISQYSPLHGFAGLLAFSREAWLETEDLTELKRLYRAEDTHLHMAIKKHYSTKHINTFSWHLRSNEMTQDHYNRGQAQHALKASCLWKSFGHSVVMLRPAVFTGYMHARRGYIC